MLSKISEYIYVILLTKNFVSVNDKKNTIYIIKNIIYNTFIVLSLLLISFIFDIFIEVFIISVLTNIIRMYSGGHHAPNLTCCYLITCIGIPIFSIFSKLTYQYIDMISFIWFLSIIYIYIKTPIIKSEWLNEGEVPKTKQECIRKVTIIYIVSSIMVLVLNFFCLYQYANSIFVSFIMVAIFMNDHTNNLIIFFSERVNKIMEK